jgi:hypothetical protein
LWDADLFSQIDTKSSGNKQIRGTVNDMVKTIDLDDSQLEMSPYKTNDNIKSLREQLKQSWGDDGQVERKPTADWMPGFGTSGPGNDEPWFTG